MPQDKALAELIREKLNKAKPSADAEKSLVIQARELIDADTQNLVFGKKYQIPKVDNLEPHLAVVFNDFLVEPLLHEGSLLLDRCLQQRREYQELKTKWFEASILVDEFLRLNDITEREENEYYDKPVQLAQFELKALKAVSSSQIRYRAKVEKIGPFECCWTTSFGVRPDKALCGLKPLWCMQLAH